MCEISRLKDENSLLRQHLKLLLVASAPYLKRPKFTQRILCLILNGVHKRAREYIEEICNYRMSEK